MNITMRKIRMFLAILSVVMIVISAYYVNYHDLSWKENKGCYKGIASMVSNFLLMLVLEKHENNKRKFNK